MVPAFASHQSPAAAVQIADNVMLQTRPAALSSVAVLKLSQASASVSTSVDVHAHAGPGPVVRHDDLVVYLIPPFIFCIVCRVVLGSGLHQAHDIVFRLLRVDAKLEEVAARFLMWFCVPRFTFSRIHSHSPCHP